MFNFLLSQMIFFIDVEHDSRIVGEMLDKFSSDVHGCSWTVVKYELSLLILGLFYMLICLGVLKDLYFTVYG